MSIRMWIRSCLDALMLFVLRIIRPIVVVLGRVHLPRKKINSKDYYNIANNIQEGDILLVRQNWNLTNIVIPGYLKHGAIFCANESDAYPFVVEATEHGVVHTNLLDFLFYYDKVVVVRPHFANISQRVLAAKKAISLVGTLYDYDFKPNNKAYYCFELLHHCYDQVVYDMPFKPIEQKYGIETITGDDFYFAEDKFTILYESGSDL